MYMQHLFLFFLPSSNRISAPTNSILLHMARNKFYFTYLLISRDNACNCERHQFSLFSVICCRPCLLI